MVGVVATDRSEVVSQRRARIATGTDEAAAVQRAGARHPEAGSAQHSAGRLLGGLWIGAPRQFGCGLRRILYHIANAGDRRRRVGDDIANEIAELFGEQSFSRQCGEEFEAHQTGKHPAFRQ